MPAANSMVTRLWHRLLGRSRPSDRLESIPLPSARFGRPLPYGVLAPPASAGSDRPPHVCYLLHGLGDDHLALDRFGVAGRLYDQMAAGALPPMTIVAPSGERGFYVDWHDGSHPYESHIIDEVLPSVEARLGLEVERERRHLLGVSMGGIGALHLGLRHPELFGSIACLSGPILDEREAVEHIETSFLRFFVRFEPIFGDGSDRAFIEGHNPFAIVRRRAPDLGQRLLVAAGRAEKPFFRDTTRRFHEFLAERGVEHEWLEFPGGHGWRFWCPVIEDRLQGLARERPWPTTS